MGIMVSLAGYKSANLKPADATAISKLASAILLAAAITGINSGIAAYHISSDMELIPKLIVTGMASLLAILIVLIVDRTMIYFTDIKSNVGKFSKIIFLLVRIIFVLAIGSVTTSAIIPVIFKNALEVQANKLSTKYAIEDKAQQQDLYDMPQRKNTIEQQKLEKRRIENHMQNLPIQVINSKDEFESCEKNYPPSSSEVFQKISSSRCADLKNAYLSLLVEYQEPWKRKIFEVDQKIITNEKEFGLIEKKINSNIEKNYELSQNKLDFNSPQVIDLFLKENKSAAFKTYSILILLCLLEMAPLGLKMFLGQTAYGMEIEADNRLKKIKVEDDVFQAEAGHLHRKQTHEKFTQYVSEMPSNHQHIQDLYEAGSEGETQLVKLKTALNAIKESIAIKDEIERIKENNPSFSKDIDELYAAIVIKPVTA
jgi:hypothetical protein